MIAGQGTAGLEVLEELPAVDTVLVPLSGGGLLAGGAGDEECEAGDPGDRREHGARLRDACQPACRPPVQVEEVATLADSLGGGIGLDNRYTFRMVRRWLTTPCW